MASPPGLVDEHRFLIIVGAGASGIVQACTLLREKLLPHDEFAILDRYGGFGGCWWKNTYPGCACDTPSHVYSVSWHRNPNWSRKFAEQKEILAYYESIAAKYELGRSAHFDTEVIEGRWAEPEMLWMLKTRNTKTRETKQWSCNVLVMAAGPFSIPRKLDVPGVDGFAGRQWHAMDWPNNGLEPVKGKRVAVIGTGPSAAQIIPSIQKEVESLVVYQRSPGHCWPRHDYEYSSLMKWIFGAFPFIMSIYYAFLFGRQEIFLYRMCRRDTKFWQDLAFKWAQDHVIQNVKDDEKQKKLLPRDPFGCKRPMFLDDYYTSLDQPNVEIITDPVVGISKTGVLSCSPSNDPATMKEVDVLIWATGYRLDRPGAQVPVYGRSGKPLTEYFGRDLYCLYGITVDDFPNMYNTIGPYSVSYWSSILEVIELQTAYVAKMIQHTLDANRGSYNRAIMLRRDAAIEFVEGLREEQKQLPASMASCITYYKTPQGVVTSFPYKNSEYRRLVKEVDFKHYKLLSARPGVEEVLVEDCPEKW